MDHRRSSAATNSSHLAPRRNDGRRGAMSTVTATEVQPPPPRAGHRPRTFSVWRRLNALALFGFAAPVAAYLWFIQHYGVNVIWRDQWSDVSVIAHSYSGNLSW